MSFFIGPCLDSRRASARRIEALKDGFLRNGVYPFHIMYDTGLAEELKDVIRRGLGIAEARAAGFATHALSFAYGQRHRCELDAAARVARALGADEHRVVTVDLSALSGSALTSASIDVPKGRETIGRAGDVPATYVPARNTVFLAVALGWAEGLDATDLFLGVNALDYSGYPDCRPEFLAAFERLASVATAAGTERGAIFRVHAPLLEMTKAQIVRRAAELGVDLGLTHTCYDPLERDGAVLACGSCDACVLRRKGFAEAGERDPIAYVS